MEAVSNIVIGRSVSVSEEGWMSVIRHKGLKKMKVGYRSMDGVEPGLVGRVVTSVETVRFYYIDLTVEQVTAIFDEICDRDTLTLKVLNISGNYE